MSTASQQKIIELSELAGGLAHEIRNPLSTLKVNLQLLAEDLQGRPNDDDINPDLQRRMLQRLRTLRGEAERLENLLNGFLKVISRHELETRRTDLNRLVQDLADFFAPQARKQNIQLRIACCDRPLDAQVDTDLVRQALLNLLINAQQAMPEGGELMVTTGIENAQARIEVTDTGQGIEPEALKKIFDPFFSTKKDGTGLGLALARRIIQEHGGTIRVQSEPGKGSRFVIQLPLSS